ncbi:uncharacterized protein MONBRDRAFT_23135 [Monosiga brevicollis MX1]|uniref:RecA family profile 1 domain-containing protein n=1 Tax=Monosiga brevicollis TaxID=81824 RepID=A9URA2_MONBE|nr:uncharacterized protein MONBRDRAFT_23135 [Monosiga brevicollis MX1]EDQ91889.1 predicted protein [Monosiga brevicollis MX1]|eukprot:XP_001743175.1 hypothetical protein [Monosiga brevicollis MX1]
MVQHRFPDTDLQALKQIATAVRVVFTTTCDELRDILEQLEVLVCDANAGLVIIDSIAYLTRKEFALDNIRKADYLSTLASLLKRTATRSSIPVLVTNQITTRFDEVTAEAYVTAALGNTWAHSVNIRLALHFAPGDGAGRLLSISKSPTAPYQIIPYQITQAGPIELDVAGDQAIGGRLAESSAHGARILNRNMADQAFSTYSGQHEAVLAAQSAQYYY